MLFEFLNFLYLLFKASIHFKTYTCENIYISLSVHIYFLYIQLYKYHLLFLIFKLDIVLFNICFRFMLFKTDNGVIFINHQKTISNALFL